MINEFAVGGVLPTSIQDVELSSVRSRASSRSQHHRSSAPPSVRTSAQPPSLRSPKSPLKKSLIFAALGFGATFGASYVGWNATYKRLSNLKLELKDGSSAQVGGNTNIDLRVGGLDLNQLTAGIGEDEIEPPIPIGLRIGEIDIHSPEGHDGEGAIAEIYDGHLSVKGIIKAKLDIGEFPTTMALGASTAVGALLGWAVFLTSRLQEVNSDMRDQTEMLTTILATVTEMSSVGHALN